MYVWLDDVRVAPDGWVWAHNVDEAIAHLHTGQVSYISLDHDMGDEVAAGGDGIAVVDWMSEHDVWPAMGVRVHSANPVGRSRMLSSVDRYSPYDIGYGIHRGTTPPQ